MKFIKVKIDQDVFISFPKRNAYNEVVTLDVEVESDSFGKELEAEVKCFLNDYQNYSEPETGKRYIVKKYEIVD